MSISLLLDMAVSGHGDRVALGPRTSGVSYGGLDNRAGQVAALLADADAGCIAFIGVNGPIVPMLLFGAARAGVPFVPLNYRLSTQQLADLVGELDRPFVVADEAYRDALAACGVAALSTPAVLTEHQSRPAPPPKDVDDDSPAVVLFTSGTTARPKGVVLRHANLVAYVMQTVDFGSAGDDEAALITVPPYHIAGLGAALTNIFAGRRMVYLPQFDAATWLSLARSEKVSSAMVVPTMLARIISELGDDPAEIPSLRSLAYGGARTPRPVLERALRSFPDTGFVNAYGLTETSSTIALLGPEEHRAAADSDDPQIRERLSSVGRLVPGMEAQIRDQDGRSLAAGEIGELWVRGPQVSGDYLGLGSVLDADGWFPTRDRARIDSGGYVFIEGRADDTIIRGGENIAPSEIEDVLADHPDVADIAVIGLPDEEWGQRLVAVVVPAASAPDPEELRSFVRSRLRGSRTPDDVVFQENLPYTPTGKLLRRELVRQLSPEPVIKEGSPR